MAKLISFDIEAREGLKQGVDLLNNAVKVTLGPQGRNVLIDRGFGDPIVTKDGVTVAKDVEIKNPLHASGAKLVRSVANKTNEMAGDGTTTATVLTQAIVAEGYRNIAAGANPMEIKKGIDIMSSTIIEELKKLAIPVKDDIKELTQVATVSANGDSHIGEMIGKTYAKVGKEGIIAIEESKTASTTVEVVEGLEFDRGFISPYFSTNKKMECQLKEVKVLIYNGNISHLKPLMPILEYTTGQGIALLIIADDVDGEALQSLVVNKMEASVKVCAVKSPGYGDRKLEYLEDIAAITGGKLISHKKGTSLNAFLKKENEEPGAWEKRVESLLGACESIVVKYDTTLIVGGKGSEELITFREDEIKTQMKDAENDYEKGKFEERLAKIQGGVGVIYVGGNSDVERNEKKDRVEDAKNATKAALEEGIVVGGGVAYLRARLYAQVRQNAYLKDHKEDIQIGMDIVSKAVEKPFRQIIKNTGGEPSVILEKVSSHTSLNYGYDAREGVFVEDMIKAGIIDPIKVARIALENAASVAGMILTTECTLIDNPEEKNPQHGLPNF